MSRAARSAPYEVVTFDCYGTLIDWEGGIAAAFLELGGASGRGLERQEILAAYAELEPVVEAEAYRSYREVLIETSRRVAERLRLAIPPGRSSFLADSLPGWSPFPDTAPALARLAAAGYRLGILSNVDDDLLAATCEQLPVAFELLVTAQQVGSYKPAPGHFLAARRRIGRRGWLHAAQSYFHDVEPARAHGIPVAWVNRKGEPPRGEAHADRELRDLTELADWLTRSGAE